MTITIICLVAASFFTGVNFALGAVALLEGRHIWIPCAGIACGVLAIASFSHTIGASA